MRTEQQNKTQLTRTVIGQVIRHTCRFTFLLLGVVCVMMGGSRPAWSQGSTATLGGRVTDQHQGVIPGAEVVVTSQETGVATHARTNGAGLWQINSLIPGHYRFTVTSDGFAKLEHSAVDLQIADVKSVDVAMKVGSVNQEVVVSAETLPAMSRARTA